MGSLLDYVPNLERAASTNGGEHAGPCPRCGGEDRLRVWPTHPDHDPGFFWCRRCDWSGDGIDFLEEEKGYSFPEACKALGAEHKLSDSGPAGSREENHSASSSTTDDLSNPNGDGPVSPPSPQWQQAAESFVQKAERTLWDDTEAAEKARAYLRDERGLSKEKIRKAGLGFHPRERYESYEKWGFDESDTLWLPRGIVIPWTYNEKYWRISIRRPPDDVDDDESDDRKYHMIKGSSGKVLYNADDINVTDDMVLLEGVFDALTIDQEVEVATAVATGSTSGARASKWRVLLSICGNVLVAFDSGQAGEDASEYWVEALPNAFRWRPHDHDANELYLSGGDLEDWVQRGITASRCSGPVGQPADEPSDLRNSKVPADSEEPLPDPKLTPGPTPASIPLPSGESIAIYEKEMRDGYPGLALDLPYDRGFINDLKSTLRGWVREWRSQEGVWVVDLLFYPYVLDMVEHHYGVEWREKRFESDSLETKSPTTDT